MEDHYIYGRGRFRQPKDRVTNLHYFRYDVFIAAINSQLHELDFIFNDEMIELLSLSSSLDPKRKFQNFKADDIYKLVSKFYPADFTEQEKLNLKSQLDLFLLEIKKHPQLDSLKSISDLCRWLAETENGEIYYLIERLVRLVLTLQVSTATAERAFSAMKLIKYNNLTHHGRNTPHFYMRCPLLGSFCPHLSPKAQGLVTRWWVKSFINKSQASCFPDVGHLIS
ncbi:hypothetical protein RND81_07G143000 [Saponaria officinalis]|uniref:HAT C-terminal dimerisation domain-containing protein n=1 Tax=Saponaria officinalis TaxID=3572 RepID=A0AAW1JTX1_SAPOF